VRTATRILTTLCILASTLAAPAEEAAEEEEESSPHRVRVWAGAKGWHLRWDTSNERAVFEGDVVLRGPGHFDAAYAVGADSTRLRIEAAPRRVQFRARYAGTSQGLDLDASGAAISLRITIDGLEDREAVFLGREGDRHPPGFPFLLPTERDPLGASSGAGADPDPRAAFSDSLERRENWLDLALAGIAVPHRATLGDAWSAGLPPPEEAGANLWLDELGWHLSWPESMKIGGFVAAGPAGVEFEKTALDTLFLRGRKPPLRFRAKAQPLNALVRLDGQRSNMLVGSELRLEKVARLIVDE